MHPYTLALLSAVPIPDPTRRDEAGADPAHRRRAQPAQPAPGLPVPHPVLEGAGDLWCEEPPLVDLRIGHQVACHFPENAGD